MPKTLALSVDLIAQEIVIRRVPGDNATLTVAYVLKSAEGAPLAVEKKATKQVVLTAQQQNQLNNLWDLAEGAAAAQEGVS